MKHNLFRNFTALLLSGTMLAGVGCKDYDDDIDNINKRLDEMQVTVSSLPEQIEAIKGSIPDLTSLTSRVADLEGKLEGVTDLKGQLDALKGLENTLKTYVDDEIGKATTADALKKTLDTYYAAATALSDLELKLTDITKEGGKIDQAVAAAVSEIQGDLTDLETKLPGWMGDEMKKYLEAKGYATQTYAKDAASGAVQEVFDQIKLAQGDYYDALVAAMKDAIVGENGTIKIGKEQLDNSLQTLIDKITPLENRVAELEGRIQSLVYVPSTLEEAQNNTIMFKGTSWIKFDESTKFYLDQTDKQTAKITFRVSPASLAEKITKENVSIVTEKIAKTRAEEPLFVVTDVTAEKETESQAYTGEFTVTAECNYNYGEVDGETLAIALNVNIAPEGSDSDFGIDYTTSYIGTDYEEGGEINNNLVIAKEQENGTFVEPDEGKYETELKYNSDETVTFLDGFSIYYKDGDEYTALSNWENAEDLIEIVAPEEKATTTGTEALYELGTTTAKFKDAANGSNVGEINSKITSKPFTFNLVYNKKTIKVGSVQHEITIVGDNTDVQADAIAMTWSYAAATTDQLYSKEAIDLAEVLDPKTYVAMKGYTQAAELAAGKYTVALTKNGQAVAGITATIALTTTPSVKGDAQQIKVTLTGDLKETATYELKAVYMHEDLTTATINATIDVTGMPTLPSYDLSNGTTSIKEYKGQNKFEMLEGFAAAYAKKVWNDELKAAFGTEETLAGIFTGITPTAAGSDEATLSVEDGNIFVTFENAAKFGESYQPTLTFTHGTIAELKVLFTSKVQLAKPANVELKANDAIISNGQATAQTQISGTSFDVIDKALDGAFFYDQSIEGLKVVYSIATDLDDFEGGEAPAIVDNKLAWNDWTGLTLDVKAALELNGRQIDEATFTVAIKDPIVDAQISTLENVNASIYTDETNKTFDVASMLKLSAQNGENVFANNDLATAIEGKPSYKLVKENPNIKLTDGVVSLITDSSLTLTAFDVEVEVNYSYKFGKRGPITVTVHIVPGAKPAETPGN